MLVPVNNEALSTLNPPSMQIQTLQNLPHLRIYNQEELNVHSINLKAQELFLNNFNKQCTFANGQFKLTLKTEPTESSLLSTVGSFMWTGAQQAAAYSAGSAASQNVAVYGPQLFRNGLLWTANRLAPELTQPMAVGVIQRMIGGTTRTALDLIADRCIVDYLPWVVGAASTATQSFVLSGIPATVSVGICLYNYLFSDGAQLDEAQIENFKNLSLGIHQKHAKLLNETEPTVEGMAVALFLDYIQSLEPDKILSEGDIENTHVMVKTLIILEKLARATNIGSAQKVVESCLIRKADEQQRVVSKTGHVMNKEEINHVDKLKKNIIGATVTQPIDAENILQNALIAITTQVKIPEAVAEILYEAQSSLFVYCDDGTIARTSNGEYKKIEFKDGEVVNKDELLRWMRSVSAQDKLDMIIKTIGLQVNGNTIQSPLSGYTIENKSNGEDETAEKIILYQKTEEEIIEIIQRFGLKKEDLKFGSIREFKIEWELDGDKIANFNNFVDFITNNCEFEKIIENMNTINNFSNDKLIKFYPQNKEFWVEIENPLVRATGYFHTNWTGSSTNFPGTVKEIKNLVYQGLILIEGNNTEKRNQVINELKKISSTLATIHTAYGNKNSNDPERAQALKTLEKLKEQIDLKLSSIETSTQELLEANPESMPVLEVTEA